MNSTLLLNQLQKIDNDINRLSMQNQKLQAEINDDSVLQDVNKSFATISEKLSLCQAFSNELESKLQAFRNKVNQFSASLYGGKIQNSKELSDLQTEIASLSKTIVGLEDEQMAKWEEIELLQAQVTHAAEEKSSLIESRNAVIEQLTTSIANNRKEAERLNIEKKGIRDQISPEFLEMYDRLFSQKKGVAVSPIEDECCQSCGTTLTPSERQQSRNHSLVIHCSNCGRILYAD